MIEFDVDQKGNPKGDIKGNVDCWLGELEYVIKDATEGKRLVSYYNKRQKRFGSQAVGAKPSNKGAKKSRELPCTQKIIAKFCQLAGVQRSESINNMWARKSFANTTLGDLQMPAATVMSITGHKSEQTLRTYYHQISLKNVNFRKKEEKKLNYIKD